MLTTLIESAYAFPLASSSDTSDVVLYAVGGGIAVIAIVFSSIKSIAKHQANEKTRREVAAYVAEGSISPEDAKKIIEAKRKDD